MMESSAYFDVYTVRSNMAIFKRVQEFPSVSPLYLFTLLVPCCRCDDERSKEWVRENVGYINETSSVYLFAYALGSLPNLPPSPPCRDHRNPTQRTRNPPAYWVTRSSSLIAYTGGIFENTMFKTGAPRSDGRSDNRKRILWIKLFLPISVVGVVNTSTNIL